MYTTGSNKSTNHLVPASGSMSQHTSHITIGVKHTWHFERFSKFSTLHTAIAPLIHIARSFTHSTQNECQAWHFCRPTEEELLRGKVCILSVENECYCRRIVKCTNSESNIPSSSSLWKLHPMIDQHQLLRVGGQIGQSGLSMNETHPIITPGQHHLATLHVSHYHGAIRTAGFWLVGGKRCISSLLYRCVTCRKLRGKTEYQQMAALPAEQLQVAPPFTYSM